MSDSDREIIGLINNFFLKAALLLEQCKVVARGGGFDGEEPLRDGNHLFNIETRGDPTLEAQIQPWTTFDGEKSMPPLVLETFLDLRGLHSNQTVYLHDSDGNPWMVCKGGKKSEIVLERWLIELDRQFSSTTGSTGAAEDDEYNEFNDPENLHKQLVLLFRYLYTLTQLLPANDIITKLQASQQGTAQATTNTGTVKPLHIHTRLLDGSKPILSKGRVGLSKPIIASYSNTMNETNIASHLEQRKITPIKTKFGSLRITVSYRKDVDFYVIDQEDPYKRTTNVSALQDTVTATDRRISSNSNISISVSPKTTNMLNANHIPVDSSGGGFARRQSISSKLQPFKVGSVGSGSFVQSGSLQSVTNPNPSLSRNLSSSSVAAALKVQRGSTGSTVLNSDLPPELSSVGSGSKYSSSFGRIRRHSSVRRSESIDRTAKPRKSNETPPEDLLEFVKLLEDKKELNMKPSTILPQQDISSSLIKFQSMKPNNDTLSDNLSMSMSIDQPNMRLGSNSHSPIPSFSPNYGSIPSRLSQGSRNNSNVELITSRKSSLDRHRLSLLNRTGSNVDIRRGSVGTMETTNEDSKEDEDSHVHGLRFNSGTVNDKTEDNNEDDDEEEILIKRSSNPVASSTEHFSVSPRSARSISVSSYTRSQLPLKHPNFSYPTTSATTAHAKFHKSEVVPDQLHREGSHHHNSSHKNDEDDDLLFVMSDMNLTN